MIPNEAMQAATNAYLRSKSESQGEIGWSALALHAALEAAAPHMLAEAWDNGSNSGYLWALKEGPWQEPDETAPTNPYKTETL